MRYFRKSWGIFNPLAQRLLYPWLAKSERYTVVLPIADVHKKAVRHAASALRALNDKVPIFDDVALLLDTIVETDQYLQASRDTKTGTATDYGFIGASQFYRKLAENRYRNIPPPPRSAGLSKVSLIVIDELIHESLHILFLAQSLRGKQIEPHSYWAEEASVTWWNAILLSRIFSWLSYQDLLPLNDDFLLKESNAKPFSFWRAGSVFMGFVHVCPWLPPLVHLLPQRDYYVSERHDIVQWLSQLEMKPEAKFVANQPSARLRIPLAYENVYV